jgi:peptidoglycan/xylan/chitin deacetylase (PgdA/CDA1 family)
LTDRLVRRRARNLLVRVAGSRSVLGAAPQGKRVLAFHDVTDPTRFRERLDWLIERYEIVAIDEWFSNPIGLRTQLALTFDDGYACWDESLVPILEERRIPAVFFVNSGLVGLQGAQAAGFARRALHRSRPLRFLSKAQLRSLVVNPLFEIGSHTIHHVDLAHIKDPRLLRHEIEADRNRLEEWTGTEVRWFAYPFGTPAHVSGSAVEIVARSGFLGAFTLVPGFWRHERDNPFWIFRDGLDLSDPPAVWAAWLDGGYDGIYRAKSRVSALLRGTNMADADSVDLAAK